MAATQHSTHIRKGLIITGILIFIALLLYFTNLYKETWTFFPPLVIYTLGIMLSVVFYSKEQKNEASFRQLFGYGFRVAAVVASLMILYTLLSGVLFPGIKAHFLQDAQEQMKKAGTPEATIAEQLQFYKNSYTMVSIIGPLVWYLILGLIAAALGAGMAKKNLFQSIQES
jgi:hypothetical protein